MLDLYKGMVDESTSRFLYLYDPENGVTVAAASPFATSRRSGMPRC
jgi:hypothetical protein